MLYYTVMFATIIQQTFNPEAALVFIPLAFGLAVGLGYAIVSSVWHRRKK
jgi:hypothetical protein